MTRTPSVAAFAGAVVLTAGLALPAGAASTPPRHHHRHHHLPAPPATPNEPRAIEGFAPYQAQFYCRSRVEPGVKAFERRILAHYPATRSAGDMRSCAESGTSEHKDGRAWDWAVDHRVPAQRRAGTSMLHWLFATDAHRNRDAMFRRLGLMYIIWNKRIWGAWSRQWEPYSCHGPTLCHVDHMHFSFGWAGAEQRTSYWTHHVSPPREPPLPHLSRRHAHRDLRVAARQGSQTAQWLVEPRATYRVTVSGVWHHGHARRAVADAVCTRTAHGWAPSRSGPLAISGDHIPSRVGAWKPSHGSRGGCDAAHHYRLRLRPQALSTLSAALPDGSRGDDSGAVRVRVTRVH